MLEICIKIEEFSQIKHFFYVKKKIIRIPLNLGAQKTIRDNLNSTLPRNNRAKLIRQLFYRRHKHFQSSSIFSRLKFDLFVQQ